MRLHIRYDWLVCMFQCPLGIFLTSRWWSLAVSKQAAETEAESFGNCLWASTNDTISHRLHSVENTPHLLLRLLVTWARLNCRWHYHSSKGTHGWWRRKEMNRWDSIGMSQLLCSPIGPCQGASSAPKISQNQKRVSRRNRFARRWQRRMSLTLVVAKKEALCLRPFAQIVPIAFSAFQPNMYLCIASYCSAYNY
jgi:hypothetical protein